jgi:enamine deaminase RidA (YjgF/YER057c/UK114 family)
LSAPDAPSPQGGYAQAVQVDSATRLLFISGQIPVTSDGEVPDSFEAQAEVVWANLEAQLRAAGMTFANLVKVTTFLADRADAAANRAVRQRMLGARTPALTVIITGIFDTAWKIEIEAIAAA